MADRKVVPVVLAYDREPFADFSCHDPLADRGRDRADRGLGRQVDDGVLRADDPQVGRREQAVKAAEHVDAVVLGEVKVRSVLHGDRARKTDPPRDREHRVAGTGHGHDHRLGGLVDL